MAPIVHGLEAEYDSKIKFVYLDIDDQRNEEIKRSLGFIYQPEYYLLNGQGQVIKKWIGRVAADDFRAEFNRNLTK